MHSTPWTSNQRSKGHLVSERIPSPRVQPPAKQTNASQSNKQPQSPEVARLQKLISYIQNPPPLTSKADTEAAGGCFCLAQVHKLSPYTPLCTSCGLVLCELNEPYRSCPFKPACGQALLSPQARSALIDSLNEKVAITLVEEENVRRREEEDRRRAAGAFPTLGPAGPGLGLGPAAATAAGAKSAPAAPHKVLSLTQKGAVLTTTRKIKTTTTTSTMAPVAAFKSDTTIPVHRIPPPPQEPVRYPADTTRGEWESLRSTRMVYVPPPQAEQQQPKAKGSKKSKKGQAKQEESGAGNTR